jgi:hypothetical protein
LHHLVHFYYKTQQQKKDQPRYKCLDCKKYFTWGLHNRPKPRHYKKERNKDPPELLSLPTQCAHCSIVNEANFKYNDNKTSCDTTQPHFGCLKCNKLFQMSFQGRILSLPSNITRGNNASNIVQSSMTPIPPTSCKDDDLEVDQGDVVECSSIHECHICHI